MNTKTVDRYCTVSESLIQSCKEVKLMREGKLPKKTWDEFKEEMNTTTSNTINNATLGAKI